MQELYTKIKTTLSTLNFLIQRFKTKRQIITNQFSLAKIAKQKKKYENQEEQGDCMFSLLHRRFGLEEVFKTTLFP